MGKVRWERSDGKGEMRKVRVSQVRKGKVKKRGVG